MAYLCATGTQSIDWTTEARNRESPDDSSCWTAASVSCDGKFCVDIIALERSIEGLSGCMASASKAGRTAAWPDQAALSTLAWPARMSVDTPQESSASSAHCAF